MHLVGSQLHACMHTHGCTLSCGAMAILPVDTLLDIVCGVVCV